MFEVGDEVEVIGRLGTPRGKIIEIKDKEAGTVVVAFRKPLYPGYCLRCGNRLLYSANYESEAVCMNCHQSHGFDEWMEQLPLTALINISEQVRQLAKRLN